MKAMRPLLISFFFLSASFSAHADVLLLVHGFMGSPASWQNSAVLPQLAAAGWQPAAIISATGEQKLTPKVGKNPLYLAALPDEAPLEIQVEAMVSILRHLQMQYPDESISIVGHSLGGLVARLALLRTGGSGVSQLITIASPHLGTPRAWQGLELADDSGVSGIFKDFLGGSDYDRLQSATPLLLELTPLAPGHPLFATGQQTHPDIRYVSIIHTGGDNIVPPASQDMNQLPALRGKSERYIIAAPHELFPGDAAVLIPLLKSARQ
ncbi:MAG: GPI inositol-deacylase [gamma proteobacterium symbiont of Bathyaustriella thionipta]|nr:GPI inositol-deacylase [gamma proteobacterium symbiont of Bathyaustriella thionipta]